MAGPTINRTESKQDYGTPGELLRPIRTRFGNICFDLAADEKNTVCKNFLTEADDSLKADWYDLQKNFGDGWLWLNPPYRNIGHWAKKCAEETQRGAKILFLVPASTGSGWYWNYCKKYGYVIHLRHRPTFEGEYYPYPKDMILVVFAYGLVGECEWHWLAKEDAAMLRQRIKDAIASGKLKAPKKKGKPSQEEE